MLAVPRSRLRLRLLGATEPGRAKSEMHSFSLGGLVPFARRFYTTSSFQGESPSGSVSMYRVVLLSWILMSTVFSEIPPAFVLPAPIRPGFPGDLFVRDGRDRVGPAGAAAARGAPRGGRPPTGRPAALVARSV